MLARHYPVIWDWRGGVGGWGGEACAQLLLLLQLHIHKLMQDINLQIQGIEVEFMSQRGSTSVSHTSATFFPAQYSKNPTNHQSLVIWHISGFGSGLGMR
jgi:hypothetical protein